VLMSQIFDAIQTGVCYEERVAMGAMAMERLANFSDKVTEG